jgi:hypothetical protein
VSRLRQGFRRSKWRSSGQAAERASGRYAPAAMPVVKVVEALVIVGVAHS